jgi:glyoxylate/hydroxypyruvate reductase A
MLQSVDFFGDAVCRAAAKRLKRFSMKLLIKTGPASLLPQWQELFGEFAPGLDVDWLDDPGVDVDSVDYVMVWEPTPGRLAQFPKLRLICSSAAGVDHITADPTWPSHVPIVRMGSADTAQRMAEFVTLSALSLLRSLKRIVTAQVERSWEYFETPRSARETRVGILGFGNLGQRSAQMLQGIGFITAGWSTTRKGVAGIESFAGPAELDAFLARSDILVCLLPDTPATRNILCEATLSKLPAGAGVINVARGGHLDTVALVAALDSGHLSGAVLDVFEPEPLPADSALWAHPNIIVSPHVASVASRRARAEYVARVIAAFERGEVLPNQYDPSKGY